MSVSKRSGPTVRKTRGLTRLAARLKGDGLGDAEVEHRLLAANASLPSAEVKAIAQQAKPEQQSLYFVKRWRTYRWKETDVAVPLANFEAEIVEEILLDNGTSTSREFVIDGHLHTGEKLSSIRVSASQFAAMTWVTEQWGARPSVVAGQTNRDHLRAAIQERSQTTRRRHVFTHTGWRVIEGQWVYLTSTGAVGLDGVEVELGPDLARFALPQVTSHSVSAMRVSLNLLRIAPLTVTVPLWASVYAAPLSSIHPMDLCLWMHGPSGALKSSLAALFQSHYGEFSYLSLPGSWSSTTNALELRAFTLKDAIFVIDDWAPTPTNHRDMQARAERVLRAQGNRSGRSRMRADLSLAPDFPPRGLIVSTGEQVPTGQSIVARTFLIECDRGQVNLPQLTDAQRQADRLPHALAGYIQWLAPKMATIGPRVSQIREAARARAMVDGQHLRVPAAVANLWVGVELALTYAEEIGAVSREEAESLKRECWDAIVTLGRIQGDRVEEEKPSVRFLKVLWTLKDQGKVVLRLRANDEPDVDERRDAEMVGWLDNNFYYLLPEAAYRAVVRFARDSDSPFPVSERRLLDDLKRESLSLGCDKERNTTTVKIDKRTKRVVKLDRLAVKALVEGTVTDGGDPSGDQIGDRSVTDRPQASLSAGLDDVVTGTVTEGHGGTERNSDSQAAENPPIAGMVTAVTAIRE